MTAPVFVDSNVLVYWLDVTEPDKQRDLLSEDLQHGQDLGGVRVVEPFRLSPDDLSSSD